jgi:hypothetical protein
MNRQAVQNTQGTDNFQSTVLAVAEAEVEQVRIHFHLYYHWQMLVAIAVGQVVDKNILSKTKEVAVIHVHNYNPHTLPRYSTHCQGEGRGLDSWTNSGADQEADHSPRSGSYSSYIPAVVGLAEADHSTHHNPAVGVEVHTSD